MTKYNRHVKAYLFVRLYGGSKAKARAAVVESFQPFAKTKRRHIGRTIRTAERRIQQLRNGKLGSAYRSYEQQKALYETWRAGRGVVAVPGISIHEKGRAFDA